MENNDGLYPPVVEQALKNSFTTYDALDAKEFDPIAFINESFPDEASLALLDPYSKKLKNQMLQAEVDLLVAIKLQATHAGDAVTEISQARSAILSLQTKINEIKSKAETSEGMVQEICRDIKKLDYAKRHLTDTITSLKRFHMLVTAVDQLDFMVQNRQYRETGQLLEALSQLFSHFEGHKNIPSVSRLESAVTKTRVELKEQIFRDFEALDEISSDYLGDVPSPSPVKQEGSSMFIDDQPSHTYDSYDGPTGALYYASDSQTPESLSGACKVIDALGKDTRSELIIQICEIWLRPYSALFGPGQEHSGLENTERRFAWFRRLIRENDEKYSSIFPPEWCMNHHLLLMFIQTTEKHLKSILGKIDPPESADVSVLVRSLRKSIDFENEMAVRFEAHLRKKQDEEYLFDENGESVDPNSALGIRMRHEKAKEIPESPIVSSALEEAEKLPTIRKVLTNVFEPYLVAYVKLESKNMKEQLQKVIAEESIERDGSLPIFSSGANLFLYIKNSIKRCTQFTNGQPFYDLFCEFKKILLDYSKVLESKLPRQGKKITAEDATTICFVLTSADYCADTLPQLEELIQSKIYEAFSDAIDMEDVQEKFYGNIAGSVRALINGIESLIEPDLTAFARTNWATFTQVGDTSKYVTTTSIALSDLIPRISELLPSDYFKTFCDKFAASFLVKFSDCIDRCNNVGDMGGQQLLLDAQAIKSILLRIPSLSTQEINFSQFSKFVTTEMQRIETLLKLVGMRLTPEVLIENFMLLWTDGTTEDLRRIMEMKGIRKQEHSSILEKAEAAGVTRGIKSTPNQSKQSEASTTSSFLNAASGITKKMQNSTYMKAPPAPSSFSAFSNSLQSSFKQSYNRAVNKSEK